MSAEKANAILRRLFPRELVEEMARDCEQCGLPVGSHKKTLAGQVFWLGCDHAKWLAGEAAR